MDRLHRALLSGLLAASLLGDGNAASAATLEIRFEGTVRGVTEQIRGGSLEVGAPVAGRLLIDTEARPDNDERPEGGHYIGSPNPILSFEVTIGDYSAAGRVDDFLAYVVVRDADSYGTGWMGPLDGFVAHSAMAGATVAGLEPSIGSFGVVFPGDRLSGDEFPTAGEILAFQPDLDWINAETSINFLTFRDPTDALNPSARVDWNLDRYTVVPEPSALALVAAVICFSTWCRSGAARAPSRQGSRRYSGTPSRCPEASLARPEGLEPPTL